MQQRSNRISSSCKCDRYYKNHDSKAFQNTNKDTESKNQIMLLLTPSLPIPSPPTIYHQLYTHILNCNRNQVLKKKGSQIQLCPNTCSLHWGGKTICQARPILNLTNRVQILSLVTARKRRSLDNSDHNRTLSTSQPLPHHSPLRKTDKLTMPANDYLK